MFYNVLQARGKLLISLATLLLSSGQIRGIVAEKLPQRQMRLHRRDGEVAVLWIGVHAGEQ